MTAFRSAGMGRGKLVVGRVAGEGRDAGDAAFLEDPVDLEAVAADVVLAQQVDLVFAGLGRIVFADDMAEHLVVGDMMAGRLGDALVAFAGEGVDVAVAELFLHVRGDGVDIVTDQPHRAGGEDGDGFGMEEVVGLLDRRRQFLLAAEDDVLLLHVGGEAVGHVVFAVRPGVGLVTAGQPGVEAAADGAVHQVDDIAGRAHDHALAAGVGAAAHGDDPRDGPHVGGEFRGFVLQRLVDHDLLGAFAGHLGRILAPEAPP